MTEKDLKEIVKFLALYGKKDSQLEAIRVLGRDEDVFLSMTQGGKNYRLSLAVLREALSDLNPATVGEQVTDSYATSKTAPHNYTKGLIFYIDDRDDQGAGSITYYIALEDGLVNDSLEDTDKFATSDSSVDALNIKISILATEEQVQADWNESDPTKVDYIKNKPIINTKYDIRAKTQAELADFYINYATIMTSYDLYYGHYPVTAVRTVALEGVTYVLIEYSQFALPSEAINQAYHTLVIGAQLIAANGNITDFGKTLKIANPDNLPAVNNATLTIKQGGVTKGAFTANANNDVEINLAAGGSGSDTTAVHVTQETWTDAQKAQARANIGAGTPQVQANWNQTTTTAADYIKNKPTIPAAQVNADWNASSGVAQILNKPTIPAAQIQSDWNQTTTTSKDYIKNKPLVYKTREARTATSQNQINMNNDVNKYITFGSNIDNLAVLNVNANAHDLETVVRFIPSTAFTIQLGTGFHYVNDEPTLVANTEYIMSIWNDLIVVGEVQR